MHTELHELILLLNDPTISASTIIKWGSPIISFGDIKSSKTATVGLNPSNREFVDLQGRELDGDRRRFHSLTSLSINDWSSVKSEHLDLILELSNSYFLRNPYDAWFKKLDYLIAGTNTSYYFPSYGACHLDLIPFATTSKWTKIPSEEKKMLLSFSKDVLGLILKRSPIETLILNGQTVVDNFEKVFDNRLVKTKMPSWELPRKSKGVAGYSYKGEITQIGKTRLKKKILVLGYNHNIQSSYGVTTKVLTSIRNWITNSVNNR